VLATDTHHEFTDVPLGSGAILPIASHPGLIKVYNAGENPLLIYPPEGGTLNNAEVDRPILLPPENGVSFWPSSDTNYYVDPTLPPAGLVFMPEVPSHRPVIGST
jgi:hypothetical protein